MWYLAGEIVAWLAAAAALGILLGWAIRAAREHHQLGKTEEEWRGRLETARDELVGQLERRNAELKGLQELLENRDEQVAALTDELTAKAESLDQLQLIFDSVQGRLSYLEVQVKERDQRLGKLQAEQGASVEERESELAQLRARIEELQPLAGMLRERDARLAELEQRSAEAQEERERAAGESRSLLERKDEEIARLSGEILRLEPLEELIRERDVQIQEWEAEMRERDTRIQERDAQIQERDAQIRLLEPLGSLVKDRDQRIRELEPLEGQLRERERQIEELSQVQALEIEKREFEIRSMRERLSRMLDRDEERSGRAVAEDDGLQSPDEDSRGSPGVFGESPRPAAGDGGRDDLKRITGIGPVLERTLNQLGYRTYQDIALWNDEDITRVAHALNSFPDRIRGDNGVVQARDLYMQRYRS
jgi:predicted flap endonuclease-1-like 5' DNA nuclease